MYRFLVAVTGLRTSPNWAVVAAEVQPKMIVGQQQGLPPVWYGQDPSLGVSSLKKATVQTRRSSRSLVDGGKNLPTSATA